MMNRTKIEWVKNPDGGQGYTLNPVSGCKNHTPDGLCLDGLFPCYAYKLANGRLKSSYLANHNMLPFESMQDEDGSDHWQFHDPFYPHFWEKRLTPLHIPRKADSPKKGIFVCDMGELFGEWIPRSWQEQVFNTIKANPDYRFYLLTKQPQNLIKFSPFPDNCWVGVTVTGKQPDGFAYPLTQIKAKVKFISFEPLLDSCVKDVDSFSCSLKNAGINWLIIGACTGTKEDMTALNSKYPHLTVMPWGKKWTTQPRIEDLGEIVEAADKAGIWVFLKDNILELVNYKSPETDFAFNKDGYYRQEMPVVK